jgi:hypothetical protein
VKKNWWKFVTQKNIWKLSMVPSHLKWLDGSEN